VLSLRPLAGVLLYGTAVLPVSLVVCPGYARENPLHCTSANTAISVGKHVTSSMRNGIPQCAHP